MQRAVEKILAVEEGGELTALMKLNKASYTGLLGTLGVQRESYIISCCFDLELPGTS